MKLVILVLSLSFASLVHAQSYSGDHTLETTDVGILTVLGDGGLNLQSNNSVQISAGGSGILQITTPQDSDVDVISGGNVVLWPNTTYNVQAVDGIQLQQASSQPTCAANTAGLIQVIPGGTGVADTLQVCLKDATDNYSWVTK